MKSRKAIYACDYDCLAQRVAKLEEQFFAVMERIRILEAETPAFKQKINNSAKKTNVSSSGWPVV